MTVPVEVNFWNMPREPSLEAAARDELRSLEPDGSITSCRVSVRRSRPNSTEPSYYVQIIVLAGPKMLRASCAPRWFQRLRLAVVPWARNAQPDTAESALRRAFAKIRGQLR